MLRRPVVIALALAALPLQSLAWDAIRMTQAARRFGPRAVSSVKLLQPLLAQAAAMDEDAKLQAINQFFNRLITYAEDIDVWGQIDYWASPLEMMGPGRGDCEDYAIAKYFSLVATGVPVAKLRMVYVRAQLGGRGAPPQAHMVLAYYASPDVEPLILDSLINEIRPASRRPDLTPVFSFNSEGLWSGVGGQTAGDPVARLSRWREVLDKVKEEGFL